MSEVAKWFTNEVLWWRSVACLGWCWVSLPLLFVVLNFCVQLPLFHPVSALRDVIGSFFQLSFWMDLIFVALVFALVVQGHVYAHTVRYTPPRSLLAAVTRPFWPLPRLLLHLIHMFLGFLLTVVSLRSSAVLTSWQQPCSHDSQQMCVGGDVLFIILHGVFVGLFFSIRYLLDSEHQLVFPTVMQGRFFRLRSNLLAVISKSCHHALQATLLFYGSYLVVGHCMLQHLAEMLDQSWLDFPAVPSPWYNLSAACHTIISAVFIQFSNRLLALLFQVFHSQPVNFAVEAMMVADNQRLLSEAMQCQQLPLLQYLAYQDFAHLSSSTVRRQPVFRLSQPGGRALTWQVLSTECLSSLQALIKTIQGEAASASAPAPSSPTTEQQSFVSKKGWPAVSPAPQANILVQRSMKKGPEIWSKSPVSRGQSPAQAGLASGSKPASIQNNFQQNLNTAWASLKTASKIPIKFIQTTLRNAMLRMPKNKGAEEQLVYSDALKHVWAAQGLCNLVVASYTEDNYGIVQQKFTEILDCLLSLLQAVEQSARKSQSTKESLQYSGRFWPIRSKMPVQQTLHACLQTGIYQIVCTFQEHFHLFKLRPENEQRLKAFCNFQE